MQWGREAVLSNFTIEDKVALVTGGDAGIGAAIALALASAGADVAIATIDVTGAERVAGEIRRPRPQGCCHPCGRH